jgi:hypothetical protein
MDDLPDSKTVIASEKSTTGPDASSDNNVDASAVDIYIDPELERKVIRKFDRYVLPQFVVLVILGYLDRTNIGQSCLY